MKLTCPPCLIIDRLRKIQEIPDICFNQIILLFPYVQQDPLEKSPERPGKRLQFGIVGAFIQYWTVIDAHQGNFL